MTLPAPYSYELPADRIAARPVRPPEAARLLVVDRAGGTRLRHSTFARLPEWVSPRDLFVFNDTKVIPARLRGRAAGSEVELLLLKPVTGVGEWGEAGDGPRRHDWRCIGRPMKKLGPGVTVVVEGGLVCEVLSRREDRDGNPELTVRFDGDPLAAGSMPVPPYVRGGRGDREDVTDYQGPFAETEGSVAAPTASLHFTRRLVAEMEAAGASVAFVTLHVGPASFRPVVRDGRLSPPSSEDLSVEDGVIERVVAHRSAGGRVTAVGTTVVRALESAVRGVTNGGTDLFITPGHDFRAVDGLVTNFHMPGTTHLLLVEALLGRPLLDESYRSALSESYRFLSYGDAMYIP